MATSGSVDFNRTRNQIVTRALRLVFAIEAGETPSAEDTSAGSEALNAMVKAWQAEGIHLWTWREATLFLAKGTVSYSLGTASGADHATLTAVKTELSAAAASGATSISVDSITGISASDNIGVELDDGTLQWTTASGAPSGTTIALAAALTGAAAVDNHVYAYTTKVNRPLRVTNVRRRDEAEQDIPILTFSRTEYFDTPNKTTQSKPTQVYYDPQLSLGTMYLWPAPEDVKDRLLFDAAFPLEDFDAATDNPDFPQEWINALTFGLAEDLAVEWGPPPEQYQRIIRAAERYKMAVVDWDVEPEPTYMQPETEWGT